MQQKRNERKTFSYLEKGYKRLQGTFFFLGAAEYGTKNLAMASGSKDVHGGSPPVSGGSLPPASFSSLFRYADSYDLFLFAIMLLCAAGTGVVIPLMSLILGKLLNSSNH